MVHIFSSLLFVASTQIGYQAQPAAVIQLQPAQQVTVTSTAPLTSVLSSSASGAVRPEAVPLHASQIVFNLRALIHNIASVIFACLSGIFIMMIMWISLWRIFWSPEGSKYTWNHFYIFVAEGALIALGSGLIFGLIAAITGSATGA